MMSNPIAGTQGRRQWELPPLILHPFTHGTDAGRLADSIRLSLSFSGLAEFGAREELDPALLEGRYCEFRMLCFVGKDLMRWMRQCADFALRDDALSASGIREQSFSDLLVNHTPRRVGARFETWGVADYRHILQRAIGLNVIFPHPPECSLVSTDYLLNYYYYADALFVAYQNRVRFTRLDPDQFPFSIYTSTEYAEKIEKESPRDALDE